MVQGVATFLSVFLVRLGASPFLVGLLTSMPALTGIVLASRSGGCSSASATSSPWYSRARVWVLSSYALTGLVPFIFPLRHRAAPDHRDLGDRHRAADDRQRRLHDRHGDGGRAEPALLPDEPALVGAGRDIGDHGRAGGRAARPRSVFRSTTRSSSSPRSPGLLSFIFSSRIEIPDNDPPEA